MNTNAESSDRPSGDEAATAEAKHSVEGHALGAIFKIEFSRGLLEAECSCSNPDGEGAGLVRFTGHSVDEVWDEFEEHLGELTVEDSTAGDSNE